MSRKTTPRVTTSSSLDPAYWRTTSHTFTPAHWGPRYCVLCNATRFGEGVVHVQPHRLPFNDPRHFGSYPSPVERLETWWKVEAWNTTKGGSCTYDVQPSYEAAVAQAQAMIENGDWKGVTYEHYAVAEMVREVVVTAFHHPIPVAAPDPA